MPSHISAAAKANTQVHRGKNIAITAPIPKAIKNNPIVLRKAQKNTFYLLIDINNEKIYTSTSFNI